jgi:hypothetical protein
VSRWALERAGPRNRTPTRSIDAVTAAADQSLLSTVMDVRPAEVSRPLCNEAKNEEEQTPGRIDELLYYGGRGFIRIRGAELPRGRDGEPRKPARPSTASSHRSPRLRRTRAPRGSRTPPRTSRGNPLPPDVHHFPSPSRYRIILASRDPLVRAPGPDLRDVGLIDLPDAGVSVLAGVRRVRPADVSPTRRSRR